MNINVKKYTKDQMAKMVEEAQAEVQELKHVNAVLTEQISQMNGEAINRANEIANLKADADALRGQLKNANDSEICYNAEQRANYAEAHPWRNLWAWAKRKLARHD